MTIAALCFYLIIAYSSDDSKNDNSGIRQFGTDEKKSAQQTNTQNNAEAIKRVRQERLQNIRNSISGDWEYHENAQYESEVEKLYTFTFHVTSSTIEVNRSYRNYVKAVGSSEEKERDHYTVSYEIEDADNLSTGDYATYTLKTNGNDDFVVYTVEYERGKFKSFWFRTHSRDKCELSRK